MKAQELKTKTSAQTLIYKIFLQRYQVYQGRLLASFQDDAKYEHVGQDTRSQGGKDDQDKQGKDLKISDIKTKSKDNDKGSRSKITKHEGTSLQRIQRPRPQDLNDKSNLIDLMKECHNELTSGEIVSLKILSRTRKSTAGVTRVGILDLESIHVGLYKIGRGRIERYGRRRKVGWSIGKERKGARQIGAKKRFRVQVTIEKTKNEEKGLTMQRNPVKYHNGRYKKNLEENL
ncbi:hypothetical protein Tco_0252967 [Tanacetum coccineum]